jgi:Ca-activated chloride channel family protein
VLTNISIDWNGLPVTDVYPREVRDLFSAKPIIITGRFTGNPSGKITIKGYQGTGDFTRSIPVDFSSADAHNAALEKIWARNKVDDLMAQDWSGIQSGNSAHKAEIIQVGLEHNLATQYTSFVAVEERTVVSDGKPVRVEVPVELPQGVSPLAVPSGFDRLETFAVLGKASGVGGGAYALQSAPAGPPPSSGYVANETVEVSASAQTVDTISTVRLTDKPEKDARLKQAQIKLSPELLAIYQCSVSRGASATLNKCSATPARIKVTIDLTESKTNLEQKLKALGFQVASGAGTKELSGTISPAKLGELAQITEVKSVSLSK